MENRIIRQRSHERGTSRAHADPARGQAGTRPRLRAASRVALSLGLAVAAAAPVVVSASAASREGEHASITVMTRNMDEGTDFGFIVGPHALPFAQGAALTYAEVLQSGIPQRSAAVADEIAKAEPDLVALQEVSLWHGPTLPPGGGTITLDALQFLRARLLADGADYRLVKVVPEEGISASLGPGLAVSFLDRDVILARHDDDLGLSHVRSGHFATQLSVTIPGAGPVSITRGWASVDVTVGGTKARFIATHLESFSFAVQAAQAAELVSGPAKTHLPVILAGDLNTGPNNNPAPLGPAQVGTYNFLTAQAGFVDSWAATHPGTPGYTDALYTEDPFTTTALSERIDLVLVRGHAKPTAVTQVGMSKVSGLWPSDHLGVVSKIRLASDDD
jgi:endonuclease/exonuclease/phosphatase family metal-dependent hydrolase